MKDPLSVSVKGNRGTTRGKEKILLTSVGIEPTTSGLDLPLLCRLSYEVGQRRSGTIKVVNRGEEKVRVHITRHNIQMCANHIDNLPGFSVSEVVFLSPFSLPPSLSSWLVFHPASFDSEANPSSHEKKS